MLFIGISPFLFLKKKFPFGRERRDQEIAENLQQKLLRDESRKLAERQSREDEVRQTHSIFFRYSWSLTWKNEIILFCRDSPCSSSCRNPTRRWKSMDLWDCGCRRCRILTLAHFTTTIISHCDNITAPLTAHRRPGIWPARRRFSVRLHGHRSFRPRANQPAKLRWKYRRVAKKNSGENRKLRMRYFIAQMVETEANQKSQGVTYFWTMLYCPRCSVTLAPPPSKQIGLYESNKPIKSKLTYRQSINQSTKGFQWKSTLDWLI